MGYLVILKDLLLMLNLRNRVSPGRKEAEQYILTFKVDSCGCGHRASHVRGVCECIAAAFGEISAALVAADLLPVMSLRVICLVNVM